MRLVNLLNCYGPRIMIPKSPSVSIVVFSMDYETSKLTQLLRTTHNDSKESFGEYCRVFYGL